METVFVLRPDVARSKNAKFFQGILDKINTIQYSSNKDFKVRRRRYGRKIYVVREQQLMHLWPSCFEDRKFSEEEEKFFELTMTRQRIGKDFSKLSRLLKGCLFILYSM